MASEPRRHQDVATKAPSKASAQSAHRTNADMPAHATVRAHLRELERLFVEHDWPDHRAFALARKRARARAREVLENASSGADVTRTVLLVAAAELLVGLRVELSASPQDAVQLAQQVEEVTGISGIAIAREALRAPELLALAPTAAIEGQLTILFAFAPLRSVSLWKLDDAEHGVCIDHVGDSAPSRRIRLLAQRTLAGEELEPADGAGRGLLVSLPIGRWKQPLAVLVGSAKPWMRERAHGFMAEAVPMLGSILERELLLAGNAASERALVESSERKLTRLGFDLHDGPIQDVAVLAEDVRLFRDQLERVIGPLSDQERVRGRIEDLEAQLVALDAELRRLSSEVQSASVLLNRPFERALRDRIKAFTIRTRIKPRLKLAGDLSLVSASQQIALLNIIHEALNNIREHADATDVGIKISADEDGVHAQVTDDGCGFELEQTLMRAAREGRVGLVAMHERVRLLGGQCRIESRPGGPTVVSVALERWRPPLEQMRARPTASHP
jgi:signal transduction histidine kinase